MPTTPNVEVSEATRLANGTLLLRGFGVPFKTHRIQAVGKLVEQFGDIGSDVAAGDGAIEFEDAAAQNLEHRFYRVIYP